MMDNKTKDKIDQPLGISSDSTQLEDKAKSLGIKYLEKTPKIIDKQILNIIPEDSAKRYGMVVFEKGEDKIKVAMIDPQDFEALNILRFIAEKDNIQMELYLTSQRVFQEIVTKYQTTEKAVKEAVRSLKVDEEISLKPRSGGVNKINEIIQDAPIAKLVEVITKHAIEGRASDIHIEPEDNNYRIRFRVDGVLYSSLFLPKEVGKAVVARIKILSNLKIDEKRKPQDGRFQISQNNMEVDFRVSSLPVVEGEKIVMRLLDKESKSVDLNSLGLFGRNLEMMSREINEPYGIILMTGPTGSGKSTTLYSFLQILNKEERNIITLEDPVEYQIEGVNQSQIKPEIGYTFASGLRSILRQDPNIIMVGEIRDSETAELAIHAALTGHLVFSTLHTNDCLGAIPRLVDMGIEPFLLSSSLRAVAAQRLVRRICLKCKQEIKIPQAVVEQIKREMEDVPVEEIKKYDLDLSKGLKFYQGKGCDECSNQGFKGRIAIFESFEINRKVQEIISSRKDSESFIKEEAKSQGMLTMRQDGILKVLKGITTLSEVERVTEGTLSVGGDIDDDKG
jgi:type IV pilus assembly protein PilB